MGPCNEAVFLGGVERWERGETTGQGRVQTGWAPAQSGPGSGESCAPRAVGQAAALGTVRGVLGAPCVGWGQSAGAFCHSPACGVVRTG